MTALALSAAPAPAQDGELRFRATIEGASLHMVQGPGVGFAVAVPIRPFAAADLGLRLGAPERYRILYGGVELSPATRLVTPFLAGHLGLLWENEWLGPIGVIQGGARIGGPRLAARLGAWAGLHDGAPGPTALFLGLDVAR